MVLLRQALDGEWGEGRSKAKDTTHGFTLNASHSVRHIATRWTRSIPSVYPGPRCARRGSASVASGMAGDTLTLY